MPRGRLSIATAFLAAASFGALLFITAIVPRDTDRTLVSVVVKRGTRISAVAGMLKAENLIRSAYLFMGCALLLHRGRIVAGEYELSGSMSIPEIVRKMAHGERKIYTLRIVEGNSIYAVSKAVETSGIMTEEAFLHLAKDPAFTAKASIPSDSVEGYLFPDTYFFSKETDAEEFFDRIIQRTFKFFEQNDLRLQMRKLHMSVFEVLCLSSIIEKEAKLEQEKPLISSVFHNRLRAGMTLDADPTVTYGRAGSTRDITKADLQAETPYNTYRLKGLPKGPICSPSKSSIMAALYPAKTDALYFVSRNDGSHVFSRTMEEHSRYVMMYQRHKNRK
jgi:UPF0755 protein